jgi:signal peptidase
MASTADKRGGIGRALRRGALWTGGLAVAALTLAIAGPLAFGARPYTVLTGSMEPAISPGDVVVAERIRPAAARVGDVVMFRDPADQERTITHRVERVRRAGDRLWFVTRGDANDHGERWRIAADGSLGRVVYAVPAVGYAANLAGRAGPAALLAIGVAILVGNELWLIWRPRRDEPEGGDRAVA